LAPPLSCPAYAYGVPPRRFLPIPIHYNFRLNMHVLQALRGWYI